MPTKRRRYVVTETDEIANAISVASSVYPGESNADVVRHLVCLGAEMVTVRRAERRRLVSELAGSFTGVYPTGYLTELRGEWPE